MTCSKFEKTRLLATRSLQIADNAPPQVSADKKETPYEVASKEFEEKKIPLRIIKYKADGTREK
ncbi:MAG: DNA-directed RNA polymerase subunit omega [Candidatus ainarchaeum sp.]|nr:DNA-directed RNA polymerase subunit omega [Candidatus ainarchaeum sp.]